jgi:hypothetical protein
MGTGIGWILADAEQLRDVVAQTKVKKNIFLTNF